MAAAGVADVEAVGHAYPAAQLLQVVAPDSLNVPAAQAAPAGDGEFDPAGHA
jgi:hypothetical protein